MSEIGDRLKKYREAIPKTLDEMAAETGIPKSNLGYYETKARGIPEDAREKLKAYGAPLAWILTGEGADPTLPAVMVQPGHKGTYPIQGHTSGQAGATGSLGASMHPRHVEEAFTLLMEVADLHQADVKDFDRKQFGRVLGIAARELARAGSSEEVRREVVHEAEILLGLPR